MSGLLEAAGAAFGRATVEACRYEMSRVEEAIATLVALGGFDALSRLARETHMRPAGLPLQALTLDGERVWEGGYDGADWGFIWRERWMHEPKRHPVG